MIIMHAWLFEPQKYAVDDDQPPPLMKGTDEELKSESIRGSNTDIKFSNTTGSADAVAVVPGKEIDIISVGHDDDDRSITGNHVEAPAPFLIGQASVL